MEPGRTVANVTGVVVEVGSRVGVRVLVSLVGVGVPVASRVVGLVLAGVDGLAREVGVGLSVKVGVQVSSS